MTVMLMKSDREARAFRDVPTAFLLLVVLILAGSPVMAGAKADFDGDGKTDFAVLRGSNTWYILKSSGGTMTLSGTCGGMLVADYDNDGKSDFGSWGPDNLGHGQFCVTRSSDNTSYGQQWGSPSDDPRVTLDYDADGKADFAVYRKGVNPGQLSYFHILLSTTNQLLTVQWGKHGDRPQPGDYDGDGQADPTVVRETDPTTLSPTTFYTRLSSTGELRSTQWGMGGYWGVPGDYDGDGKTDIAVYNSEDRTWYILKSSGGTIIRQFGTSVDIPVPGDYDGDGKTDLAVWRRDFDSGYATFFVLKSSGGGFGKGGVFSQQLGLITDLPAAIYQVYLN